MNKRNKEITIHSSAAEYLTFIAAEGGASERFEIRYEDENIWLTQKMMAELYDVSVPTINHHLNHVFSDGEISRDSTIRKYLIVQNEGGLDKTRAVDHYNLQAIIAVGFKINNPRAVQFRKWAGQIVQDRLFQSVFDRFILNLQSEIE
ncbi:MAG: virulence RhuM family protein [Spirochaetales bacterium]|nr:virulence RhuM family protein [Spirochaetales bacterium]